MAEEIFRQMKIGLDLDNTIVDCDAAFCEEARRRWPNADLPVAREDLRRYVRDHYGDPLWTDIQAEVYGPLYERCRPCTGALEAIKVIAKAPQVGEIVIISHKTKVDSAGKNYPLRDYARRWIDRHLAGAVDAGKIFFAETKQEKVDLIVAQACNVFLDDLPEIIQALQGKVARPVLFQKTGVVEPRICDWPAFQQQVCHG